MSEMALPTARDWMVPSPFVLEPGTDLFTAIELLVRHRLPAAPVVGEDGTLLGMLTEKDCLRVLSRIAYDDGLDGGTVRDFQSKVRVLCEPDMDLFRVLEPFLATNFPMLPVVEEGRLVGLIRRHDLLREILAYRARRDKEMQARERAAGRQADRPRGIETLQRTAATQSREQLVRLLGRKQ